MKKSFLSSIVCFTLFTAGSCGVEAPKPVPRPPLPSPTPELPTPEPVPPETPKPPVVESCVNGRTYQVETKSYRGFFYKPKTRDCAAPLVVGNNGTGAPSLYYARVGRALAAKGFAVIWPENPNTGDGRTCMAALEYGFRQPYILQEHYAITGHSQGGSATVVCGGLAQDKWPSYKAALLPNEAACGMSRPDWKRQANKIKAKTLFFAGSRDTVVSERWVRQCFDQVRANKALIIGVGASHMDSSAWMEELAPAFFKAALFDDIESWGKLNDLNDRKWKWRFKFESI